MLPKQTHLPRVLIAACFLPCPRGHARCHGHLFDALGGLVAGFELLEDFLGAVDDVFGEAGESGDLDAVAFFGAAGEDLAEEDDLLVPLLHGDVVVLHGAAALR